MTGIIIALVSGILMSVQGVFNTQVTRQTSLWVSAGWVQLTALAVCIAAWIFTGRQELTALFQVTPRYVLLGGVIGAAITVTVIQSMNSLGPAQSALLIVIAQLIAAWLIELFGLFGMEKTSFEWRKLIGMAVAIAGIILFKWEKIKAAAGSSGACGIRPWNIASRWAGCPQALRFPTVCAAYAQTWRNCNSRSFVC